jgi:arsenate reductase-like glutaredoxin family protein
MIQIFGAPGNRATQKTVRFFKERRIPHQFIDLSRKPMSRGELESIMRSVPLEKLVDRESAEYEKQGIAYMDMDLTEALLENPLLFTMPVVRNGTRATAGSAPEVWEMWLKPSGE